MGRAPQTEAPGGWKGCGRKSQLIHQRHFPLGYFSINTSVLLVRVWVLEVLVFGYTSVMVVSSKVCPEHLD